MTDLLREERAYKAMELDAEAARERELARLRDALGACFDYFIENAEIEENAGKCTANEEWNLAMSIHWLLEGTPEASDWTAVVSMVTDYLHDREDVRDGSYGVPEANTEMSLLQQLRGDSY